MKKQFRLTVDILMTALLPLPMAYSLIGEAFHEVIGTSIFILFIIHHILNRKWYCALFRGKYSRVRVFRTVLDMLLLVFMILQPVSGVLMSKHLYTFLPALPVATQARTIHMLLAYWGYVLMCIHAGTHLAALSAKLGKQKKSIRIAVCSVLCGISVYGCYSFVKRGFPGYMSGTTMFAFFDFSEPVIFFVLDYLAVMILFMMIGYLVIRMLSNKSAVSA